MSEEPERSEFGKGYAYCLGLFLAHAERAGQDQKTYKSIGAEDRWPSMWFNAAADHLYDLQGFAQKHSQTTGILCR